jgi:LysR family glycine cleavage system transcriptional activator
MNSPLRRSLPPLNALRAFEAAARHLNLSLAANELNVTPAAISHQVRLLEEHIGLPVFERNGRGLALSDAGAAGLPDLREAFARLSAAMDAIESLGETDTLSVSVAPSFAAKWLLPRLESFERERLEIDVHVSVSMQLGGLRSRSGRRCDSLRRRRLSRSVLRETARGNCYSGL